MKTFQWNRVQLRVWYNEGVRWSFTPETLLEARLQAPPRLSTPANLAVELLVDLGERYLYGALAATFAAGSAADALFLHIPLTDAEGPIYEDALAARIDLVRIGLPREYGNGVQSGLQENSQSIGAGTLQIVGAVHGQLHSSHEAFRKTGLVLMQVLSEPQQLDRQESMTALLQQMFQRSAKK